MDQQSTTIQSNGQRWWQMGRMKGIYKECIFFLMWNIRIFPADNWSWRDRGGIINHCFPATLLVKRKLLLNLYSVHSFMSLLFKGRHFSLHVSITKRSTELLWFSSSMYRFTNQILSDEPIRPWMRVSGFK